MEVKLPSEINFKSILQIRKYTYLPLFVIIFAAVLVVTIIVPRLKLIFDLRKETSDLNEELLQLNEKKETLEGMDEATLLSQIQALEKTLPSNKSVVRWILSIRGISEATGIESGKLVFQPGSVASDSATASAASREVAGNKDAQEKSTQKQTRQLEKSDEVQTFKLSFDVSAPFINIVDFLSRFDDLSPLIKVTGLEFSTLKGVIKKLNPGEEEKVPLDLHVNVLVFYSENPEKLGPITTKILPVNETETELYQKLLSYKEYLPTTESAVNVGREDPFADF